MKSSISRAVVFGSTVTGFSVGAAGALVLAHSSTMLFAWAGSVSAATMAAAAIKLRFMNILLDGRLLSECLWARSCASNACSSKRQRRTPLAETPAASAILQRERASFDEDRAAITRSPEEQLYEHQGRQTSDRRGNAETQELGTVGQRRPDRHAQSRDARGHRKGSEPDPLRQGLRAWHSPRPHRSADRIVRRALQPDPS